MNTNPSTNSSRSSKSGLFKVVLILSINAIAIFLFARYILYPYSNTSEIMDSVSEISDMTLIDQKTDMYYSVYLYESTDNRHYVIATEESFLSNRFRILPDGSFCVENQPLDSYRVKTFTGLMDFVVTDEWEIESLHIWQHQNLAILTRIYASVFVLLCIAEFLLWKFIPRKKNQSN